MKYIIFDTETTDLNGDVIQMSFIVLNENFRIEAFESFYCDTNKLICDEAFSVHGLTNEFVHEQSCGRYLEDYLLNNPMYKKLFFDEEKVVFVGYNINFDIGAVNNTLMTKTGLTLPLIKEIANPLQTNGNGYFKYDLMTYFKNLSNRKNNFKLADMVSLYLSEYDMDSVFERVAKRFNLNTGNKYHDASYDTFCTLMLFYVCLKRL